MTKIPIHGITLNIKVYGHGYPLVLMHGGPGADLYTMLSFKPLADQFTLVFYDHRCNGRSVGPDVTSMTMENLTADADALRQALGFEKWAVLGHSFGGNVALEYALRYSQNLSHLLLVNSGADYRWPSENAPRELAKRGYSPEMVELTRRYFNGLIEPKEMFPTLMKLGKAYSPYIKSSQIPHMILMGMQTKLRPDAMIFGETKVLKNWNIMGRLHEITTPTLIMAGNEDFVYPPESQKEMAARIPNARLELIDRSGHNPQDEQTDQTLQLIRDFLAEMAPSKSEKA
jgi:pimeloyl-ACP methyl ester carboxylesterase